MEVLRRFDSDIKITASSLICSKHFGLSAFKSNFGARKLKPKSIPELFSCEEDFDILPTPESDVIDLPPPIKKKRLLYPGDFGEEEMKIATKALLYKKITEEKLKTQQNTIRNLTKKNDRITQKCNSKEDLINNLLANEMLSEDAAGVLMVLYLLKFFIIYL